MSDAEVASLGAGRAVPVVRAPRQARPKTPRPKSGLPAGKGRRNAWDSVPWSQMTAEQQVAAQTHGVGTIPNLISLGGFGLSMEGLWAFGVGEPVLGTLLFAAGSAGDLLDGRYSRWRGVTSAIGERLDAGLDKGRILIALGAMAFTGIMPLWEIGAVAGPQLAIMGISGVAKLKGNTLHASRAGKWAAFAATAAVVCNMAAVAFDSIPTPVTLAIGAVLHLGGIAASVTSAGLGLYAAAQYSPQAFASPDHAPLPPKSPTDAA